MLPSRLFRCIGIPPPLRSLMVIHPALPPSLAVQLRLRLQILPRSLSTSMSSHSHSPHTKSKSSDSDVSLRHHEHCHPSSSSLPPARTPEHEESERSKEQEPRLQLTFTCTVSGCSERSTHRFTKRAYERGIVLVTCPKCKNRLVFICSFFILCADCKNTQTSHCRPHWLV